MEEEEEEEEVVVLARNSGVRNNRLLIGYILRLG